MYSTRYDEEVSREVDMKIYVKKNSRHTIHAFTLLFF